MGIRGSGLTWQAFDLDTCILPKAAGHKRSGVDLSTHPGAGL
jgi:hypothetical protein